MMHLAASAYPVPCVLRCPTPSANPSLCCPLASGHRFGHGDIRNLTAVVEPHTRTGETHPHPRGTAAARRPAPPPLWGAVPSRSWAPLPGLIHPLPTPPRPTTAIMDRATSPVVGNPAGHQRRRSPGHRPHSRHPRPQPGPTNPRSPRRPGRSTALARLANETPSPPSSPPAPPPSTSSVPPSSTVPRRLRVRGSVQAGPSDTPAATPRRAGHR